MAKHGPLRAQLGLVSVGDISKLLSEELDREITYKQVWAWTSRTYNNNFPQPKSRERRRRGILVPVYDPDEVMAWHQSYVPDKGGHPFKNGENYSRQSRVARGAA